MKTSTRTLLLIFGIALVAFITFDMHAAPSFVVNKVGNGKKAMIFIPGLTCPGDVWNETVEHYKDSYTCHVISLPGFAGTTPVTTEKFLESMREEIVEYIRKEKLKKPILVGHSLGGFLALSITSKYPDLASMNIIVDALPFIAATQDTAMTEEKARPNAEMMRKMMANATPQQVKESQKYFLNGMINNPEKKELVSKWGMDSHAPTVAQAMYELQTSDLRDDIASIKVPTLVLGAWIAYKDYGFTKEAIQKTFVTQYRNLKNKEIVLSEKGKHFLMYDDGQWMMDTADAFIKNNK